MTQTTTNFQRTANWLEACGKTPGDENDFSVQMGCDIEETVELLMCLETTLTPDSQQWVAGGIKALSALADGLKSGLVKARIREDERAMFLDSICDREVTGNGLAFLASMDKDGADQAVLDSNDAKLVDGKPVLSEGGKILKPDGWTVPDLTAFAATKQDQ